MAEQKTFFSSLKALVFVDTSRTAEGRRKRKKNRHVVPKSERAANSLATPKGPTPPDRARDVTGGN